MGTPSVRLLVVVLLGCTLLPLTSVRADAPAPAPTCRLESLLTAHDVRNAIHAPRPRSSDCLHTDAERGR
jgi:hypothetical protein